MLQTHGMTFLATKPEPAAPARPRLTPGQRWRRRRDLLIYVGAQNGFSQRMLGEIFDLPHSRISAILSKFRREHPQRPAD